jgi:hypothetical protein
MHTHYKQGSYVYCWKRSVNCSPPCVVCVFCPHHPAHSPDVIYQEKTLGLLVQAFDRAPRWAIKKLTATYLTLGLADIGKAVNINSEEEVRALILSMVRPNGSPAPDFPRTESLPFTSDRIRRN